LHVKRIISLSFATFAVVMAVGVGTAAAAGLTGAGSTLVAPLVAKWAAGYQSQSGTSVTYGAVGSGAGITAITSRTVDFGASDAPLTADQFTACNGCVQIPWALSATAISFNLPGIKTLKMSGPVLSEIYLGQITNWNDPAIAKLNKGVTLPNLTITPVFRSDGSGDTYAFTDYLSHVNPTFSTKVGTSTQVSFPTGASGKGNSGVAAVIGSTSGAIGYISAFYVRDAGLTEAQLQNAAGNFEYAYLPNIEDAANSFKAVGANNEMHIVDPIPSRKDKTKQQKAKDPATNAYPLSTFTYAIVPKAAKQLSSLVKFIDYALSPTGQAFGPPLTFAALPKYVLKAAQATVASLTQG
jgi:phosphate transport system substrate-binding protein